MKNLKGLFDRDHFFNRNKQLSYPISNKWNKQKFEHNLVPYQDKKQNCIYAKIKYQEINKLKFLK